MFGKIELDLELEYIGHERILCLLYTKFQYAQAQLYNLVMSIFGIEWIQKGLYWGYSYFLTADWKMFLLLKLYYNHLKSLLSQFYKNFILDNQHQLHPSTIYFTKFVIYLVRVFICKQVLVSMNYMDICRLHNSTSQQQLFFQDISQLFV